MLFIIIKSSIDDKDITIINVYEPKNQVSKYMKQKLTKLKGEIDRSTIMVGDLNIPLSVIDRTNRKSVKILKT